MTARLQGDQTEQAGSLLGQTALALTRKDKGGRAQRMIVTLSSTEGTTGPNRNPDMLLRSQVCLTRLSGSCKMSTESFQSLWCACIFQPPTFPNVSPDFWLIYAVRE